MSDASLHRAADPKHLTAALRAAGVLAGGRVREASIESTQNTVVSQIIRLRVSYDAGAEDAPSSLILKMAHPDRVETFWFAGRSEVAFYRELASQMPPGSVPRCFEATYDEPTKRWHLLLEDLTDTHQIPTTWPPLPPELRQCEAVVAGLARMHAAWWGDAKLGSSIGRTPDDAFFQRFAGMFDKFDQHMGDRLNQPRRELYLRLIEQTPRLRKRFDRGRDMTITHGDAHVWNFMLPREGVDDMVRMFDWDSWRVGMGADDLAYMIAMHWFPERRARFERQLLDRYHEALLGYGVTGYGREALDADYRLATLFHTLTPMVQWQNRIPPVIWWNHLDRIMMAVDDLACRELLD